MSDKFKTTTDESRLRNGFQITFENGCTVSVQFGQVNYSDQGKTTAEVAAWGPDGNWIITTGGNDTVDDTVRGYCSPEEVLSIMNTVANIGRSE